MGNTISYIGSHGKRLLNRYNAQFRALQFLEKEKLASAPKHPLPPSIQPDPMVYEHLQNKDPSLDKFLKDVYLKSYDMEPLTTCQKHPERPLPVYNESSKKDIFKEPTEIIKGLCTLSQFFEFRAAHENDPVTNSAAVIAKNYSLDVKKVENLLKYYSIFTVHRPKTKEQTKPEDDINMKQLIKSISDGLAKKNKLSGAKAKSTDETRKDSLQLKSQDRETLKADRQEVKNQ